MSEEAAGIDENNILQWMTLAMKSFKLILHQLQSQYRAIYFQNNSKESYQIQQLMNNLQKSAIFIEGNNRKKMLNNRLINRFIQIITIYRNKCSQNQSTLKLRDHFYTILLMIKEHQSNFNQTYNNQINTNNDNQKNTLSILFDKICLMFKKIIKQLKQLTNKSNSINTSLSKCVINPVTQQNTINNNNKQKQKEKQRERRNSLTQTPPVKSMQYKYKLTKQIIGNVTLLVGMDIDLTHLRGFFYQAKNNLNDTFEQRMQANQLIKQCRDRYSEMYNSYRNKVKRRNSKKQKLNQRGQTSPQKMNKSVQNKAIFCVQKNTNIMTITTNKMPKLMQSTYYNSNICQQGKKRLQFKNMQALTFNRQFIHLSQIKNQKLARRPYAEVKQVLVAGDQLNYYSNKYQNVQNSYLQPSKASFFMQRAAKNQKIFIRKKSFIENCRMATQE